MKNKFNCGTTKGFFGIIAIILMLATMSVSVLASESILTPTKDSYVSSAMPNTNYGASAQLAVRANLLYPKRALIQFANLPTVPPSYRVNSAVMRLYIEKAPWALETYNAERISSDWSETLVNWKNQPATAGISGSAKVNTTGWINIDVTDDVKGFYDGILENKGWVIKDSIEGTAIFTQEGIAKSKENGNPLLTPQLVINYCVDNDADGYFRAEEGCGPVDCNDYDASVNPGAPEKCDNIDNNCNGIIDEDVSETQTCGTEVGACEFGTKERTCSAGTWGAWGTCTGGITPVAESCDALDNDCDGSIDENLTRAYGESDVGECEYGTETCTMGAWLITTPAVFSAPEICDNKDNDCDGLADNGVVRSCYTGIPGTGNVGICREGTETCSAGTWGACIGQILPEQEICENGIDENCNGRDEPCFGSVCAGTNIPDTVLAGSVFSASVTMRNIGEDVWTQFYAYRLGSASPNDNVVWGKSRAEMGTGDSAAKGQE
ncbi:MAG: MopE-related protein, partial [Candidatus Woesearchaeota archaeon]|nr:MopE-related protein [Candidatus Woesearchaeota archaeon]